MPFCHEWDESGDYVPASVFRKCGEAGILTSVCGAPWPKEYVPAGILPPGGVSPEEFDPFHDFIVKDELARAASGGALWGLMGGHTVILLKSRSQKDCIATHHPFWESRN